MLHGNNTPPDSPHGEGIVDKHVVVLIGVSEGWELDGICSQTADHIYC